jgi:hypothetical protein
MDSTQGPAPAIDPSQLLPNITRYCLTDGDAAHLALDGTFMNATFRSHQIVRLCEFASDVLHISLPIRAVARTFEADHSVVKRAQLRDYTDSPARGRHNELAPESEQAILQWIAKNASDNKAVNRTKLLNHCIEQFGKHITRGWVDSFLIRHTDTLFETKSVPQENPRLEVPVRSSKRRSKRSGSMFIICALSWSSTSMRLKSASGKIVLRRK